jgi:uncharacterized OB-fold protein
VPDLESAAFWEGLRNHQLLILQCDDCGFWVHPPLGGCPLCLSSKLTPRPVSGRGTIYSFTISNREVTPGVLPPYAVALVDLEEQQTLRFVTMVVNVKAADVRIGMPVKVHYHDVDDATLALFEPTQE